MPNIPGSESWIHRFDALAETVWVRPDVLRPGVPWTPALTRGKLLRSSFARKSGYMTCETDFSQMELRILAQCMADTSTRRHSQRASFDLMYGLGTPTTLPKARVARDLLLRLFNDPCWNSGPTIWERLG